MTDNVIEHYLSDMSEIRGSRSNAPETSFYPALEKLLTSIGKNLNPKVRCVINLANRGAGLPDGGLFTADQFGRKARSAEDKDNPFLAQNPSRGVIEAKPPSDDLNQVTGSEQVERYWKRYGMVLVTNFRAFALIGQSAAGQPTILESFSLAESEKEFWQLTAHPRKTASERGERMLEYLRRVLLHNAPLAEPKDVATILASYAHDARLRIEHAELPALENLRKALEDSLGLAWLIREGNPMQDTRKYTVYPSNLNIVDAFRRMRDALKRLRYEEYFMVECPHIGYRVHLPGDRRLRSATFSEYLDILQNYPNPTMIITHSHWKSENNEIGIDIEISGTGIEIGVSGDQATILGIHESIREVFNASNPDPKKTPFLTRYNLKKSVFLAHRFDEEGNTVAQTLKIFLSRLGFQVVEGEGYETRNIPDKVTDRIRPQDIFVLLVTPGDAAWGG